MSQCCHCVCSQSRTQRHTHPSLRRVFTEPSLSSHSPSSTTLAAAPEAALSFLDELKARDKAASRSLWLQKSSTVTVHPKTAVLSEVEESVFAARSTASPLPFKGFHVSSCVPRHEIQWQWQRHDGTFESYSDSASVELEKRFRQGKPFAKLSHEGRQYDIMFATLTQVTMDGDDVGQSRLVRCSRNVLETVCSALCHSNRTHSEMFTCNVM